MKCSVCGYSNADYLEYCENCGSRLSENRLEKGSAPSWGFVKAPRWPEPDFSAENVSEDDIPDDFETERSYKEELAVEGRQEQVQKSGSSHGRRKEKAVEEPREERRPVCEEESYYEEPMDDENDYDDDDVADDDRGFLGFSFGGRKRRDKRRTDKHEQIGFDDIDEDEDDFDDYEEEEFVKPQTRQRNIARKAVPKKKSKSSDNPDNLKKAIALAAVVAGAALIAILVWAIFFSGGSNGGNGANSGVSNIIVDPNESGVYLVTVYADEGAILNFISSNGERSQDVTVTSKKKVVFRAPEDTLLPGAPIDGAVYNAVPNVVIKNADGTETKVDIKGIDIAIPALNLTFTTPADIATENGIVTIEGSIVEIAAALTLNGEPVTINADGSFSHQLTFTETGSFTVTAEAKMNNYQIARQTFNVTVSAPAVVENPIKMPYEYGDTSYSQRIKNSIDTISIWGMVPAGYSVTVASASTNVSFPAAPTVDAEGKFTFDAKLAVAGDFVITITATDTASGKQFTRDIHVQRAPEWSSYIQSAWAMNFAAFSQESSQAYEIKGSIIEIIEDGDYVLAKFQLTDGNIIMIEYHDHYGTAGSLTQGGVYNRLYGRPLGLNEEGIPQFYIWFVEG